MNMGKPDEELIKTVEKAVQTNEELGRLLTNILAGWKKTIQINRQLTITIEQTAANSERMAIQANILIDAIIKIRGCKTIKEVDCVAESAMRKLYTITHN